VGMHFASCLAARRVAATRAKREEFFLTHMSSEKTIEIYFASADAKICDAFLPVCRLEGGKCGNLLLQIGKVWCF